MGRNITKNNSVGADFCVITDLNTAKNFCPGADVHMTADDRKTGFVANTNADLLKNQAVDTNFRVRVDYDSIWVGHDQTTAKLAIERNVRATDGTEKTVLKDKKRQVQAHAIPGLDALIPANDTKELFPGLIVAPFPFLTLPVGFAC
jgi:hypothetical protein